jgi:hypothetical protein
LGINNRIKKTEWERIRSLVKELRLSAAEVERRLRNDTEHVPAPQASNEFPIFKSASVGIHKTIAQLKTAVAKVGGRLAPSANCLLTDTELSTEETSISFILVTAAQLGFERFAKIEDVFKKGYGKGYKPCSPEEVAMLRLATMDQKNGEQWIVATAPSKGNDPVTMAFLLSAENDVRLLGNRLRLSDECVVSRLYVFKK